MSSVDESDDEFESADEDIDFEPTTNIKTIEEDSLEKTCSSADAKTPNDITDQHLQQIGEKLSISSQTHNDCDTHEESDLKSERDIEEKTETAVKSDEQDIQSCDNNKTKEVKIVVKGRKLMRKADRFREQTDNEDSNHLEPKSAFLSQVSDVVKEKEKTEDTIELDIKSEEQNIASCDESSAADKTNEVKTAIKGRKLMRKADRLKEQISEDDSDNLEQKKSEVLNKLSNLSESSSSSNWNWFSDIKSAAKTATSTTVSHVSQASNKWSFDPKSLLSGAAALTTTVGSGLSSVVDNVALVMDSAIGAPPPEQMAAMVNKDSTNSNKEDDTIRLEPEPDSTNDTNSSKSGFGFGLFDYTLNTLESIGKKTMEVIHEDNKKTDKDN